MRNVRSRRSAALLGALICAAALVVSACSSSGSGSPVTVVKTRTPGAPSSAAASTPSTPASSTSSSAKPGLPVHVSSAVLSDGSQVGVGMPIILLLSRPIKDARASSAATKVTVNGTAVNGGWYFENKYGDPGHPIEADYRMANYWPGHAQIHLDLPVKGVSAGTGLTFDNDLTLDFTTGPANVLTVDEATHKVTVTSDGKVTGTYPTSLGANNTPTVFRNGGKEYVAFYAGGNGLAATQHGDNLWLFGLDGKLGPVKAGGPGKGVQHAGENTQESNSSNGDPTVGKGIFSDNCSACHGLSGHGGNGGPDLTSIPSAKKRAVVIRQVQLGGGGMPGFESQLTPKQIADVAAYVLKVTGGK